MREFESGATRDDDEGKLDYFGFLSPFALERFAKYMHEHRIQSDGSMRDSDNWKKGIPEDEYMRSLFRHFMEVWLTYEFGGNMEEPLCAMLFNVQGLLHESVKP